MKTQTTITHVPIKTVPIRIRFSGTQNADLIHMSPEESARFQAEWRNYIDGSGEVGGEYMIENGDTPYVISLNFSQIAFIEPGKQY